MNIVCVYIRADKGVLTTETLPLGIAYISSSLVHAGYNTEMLFINARTDIYKILTAVSSFVLPVPQALFAISVMGENEFSFVKKITSAIKKLFPNAQIIAGGTHVQYMPEIFTVENLNIDALCVGEGETVIKKYVSMLHSGNFEKTDNLWLKQTDGSWLKCARSVFEGNIDALPFPDRTVFKNITVTDTSVVMFSRGCPNNCIFCLNTVFKKNSQGAYVRHRKTENIIAEIKYIQKNYPQTKRIVLNDDTVLNIAELCEVLKGYNDSVPEKIRFTLRLNFLPKLLDENIINCLKAANVDWVQVGFESGCPELRKRLNRPYYTNEQILEFTRGLQKNGIKVELYAMYCHPFETAKTYARTIKWLKEIKADILRYRRMIPFKGTELACYIEKNGIKKLSLIDRLRLRTTLFRVYISYKPFLESLLLLPLATEEDWFGLKTLCVKLYTKVASK